MLRFLDRTPFVGVLMRKLRAKSFKSIPGKYYRTPKELWGFRTDRGDGSPSAIARTFLETNRDTLGITSALDRLDVRRVIHAQGADHVILQQLWKRRRIHRAYVTVHIGRDRRVYLVKSRAVPEDVLRRAEEPRIASATAVRAAMAGGGRGTGRAWVVGKPELLWYPARRLLHPAWRVRIHRTKPRAEVITYVHAVTGRSSAATTTWPRRRDGRPCSCRTPWPWPAASSRSTGRDCSALRRRRTPS